MKKKKAYGWIERETQKCMDLLSRPIRKIEKNSVLAYLDSLNE